MFSSQRLAKDYNQNATALNSIIAKLANLDEILKNLRQVMNEEKSAVDTTKNKKDELDTNITRELEKIRHDLYDKLNRMLDDMKNHQSNQRAEALKLQQEISILKKEKLELYQRVTDLQRRISDMEITVGQDYERK
jgi:chromosome segregation ATPase